jgi:hypothetical protein
LPVLLYRRKAARRRHLSAFATDQGSGGCSVHSDSGRDLLQHHASALRIGRGYTDEAHCDYLLGHQGRLGTHRSKAWSMHFTSPNNGGNSRRVFARIN